VNLPKENAHPFQRLQAQLADLISTTEPGDRLPSEPVLAQQLGVSRATLREAMRTFECQGLLQRRQGIGTFVVERTRVIESGLEVLESIETMARKINLDVSMGNYKIEQVSVDAETKEVFEIPNGAQLVRVTRVIMAESRPVAYLVDLLPTRVLSPEDLQDGFTGSVLDWLLRRGSPVLSRSSTQIQAVAAPAKIARALRIQRGDVLLHFSARLYEASGSVVDQSQSYFLPGYFRFHVIRSPGMVT
jgi:GntR family transcriptional regulator